MVRYITILKSDITTVGAVDVWSELPKDILMPLISAVRLDINSDDVTGYC